MKTALRLVAFALLAFLLSPVIALAQDAGTALVLPTNVDQASVTQLVTPLLNAPPGVAHTALLVILGVMLLTFGVRKFGSKLPAPIGPALASPLASWVVPLVFSVAGALGTSLAAGAPLSLTTFVGALIVALGAGGVLQKQIGAAEVADANKAATDAAAKVDTKAEVVDILKGPKP